MTSKKTENLVEYRKRYREKNPDYWKQKVFCEVCNQTMTLSTRSHHKRSMKHLFNEMKLKMAEMSQKENNNQECENNENVNNSHKDNNGQECENQKCDNNNQKDKK